VEDIPPGGPERDELEQEMTTMTFAAATAPSEEAGSRAQPTPESVATGPQPTNR